MMIEYDEAIKLVSKDIERLYNRNNDTYFSFNQFVSFYESYRDYQRENRILNEFILYKGLRKPYGEFYRDIMNKQKNNERK